MPGVIDALAGALEGHVIDGRYYINRVLGAGGFGLVVQADWRLAGDAFQKVAIKLIETARASEEQLDELREAVNLSHSALVRCYTVGDTVFEALGKRVPVLFVVMELATETLDDRLRRGLLGVDECIDVGLQVAKGLGYLRDRNRVHRDIKPSNILNCGSTWKIGDLGLVKELPDGLTVDLGATGTIRYCPPEAWGKKLSTSWDVWSLGVTLLEALTNQAPYAASTPIELIQRMKREEPQLPVGIPEPFDAVIRGCLQRDRKRRFTPSGIVAALSRASGKGKRRSVVADIRVAPSGGDFRTLKEAIQHAPAGARIAVAPGRYVGAITIDKPVEVIGDGAVADVILDGVAGPALRISSSDVRVRGISLRASEVAGRAVRAVLEVTSGACEVDLCEIQSDSRDCIYVAGYASQPAFRRLRVLAGARHGVVFDSDAEGLFEASVIIGGRIAGCVISDKANPVLRRSSLEGPGRCGILVTENGRGLVERCRIGGGEHGAIELAKGTETIFRRSILGLSGAPVVVGRAGAKAMFIECTANGARPIDWNLSKGHRVKHVP